MEPLYSAENTAVAYQLNWSLSLFGTAQLPSKELWLKDLQAAIESDGLRILSAVSPTGNLVQFFISTRPELAPSEKLRSVKARLQYLIRNEMPKAFRRNYHVQSVGDAKSSVLNQYVAGQTLRHPMADPKVQARLESCQFFDNTLDLSKPIIGRYGQYLHSLQIVLENAEGWNEVSDERLNRIRRMIVTAAKKKSWRLSRIGLLSNHVHILLGAAVTESPQSIALSLMNNIAYVYRMKSILKFSYYLGTFGGYDRGAIRQRQS